jgi:peptide chain release factor 2
VRDYREIKRDIDILRQKTEELYTTINIASEKERLTENEALTFSETFWADQERSAKVNQEIRRLTRHIEPWDKILRDVRDASDLLEIANAENDAAVMEEIDVSSSALGLEFERLQTLELLSDEDDTCNAYLTIHPGAGGTESQDWALMLFRMYTRWAEKQGFSIETIDYTPGEEAGIKNVTVLIKGEYAFGFLKCERGVHRLVRISPFDANKRRHTSFTSVEVTPDIDDSVEVEINETELRIDTFRSSGAGGQHVNTTDSAIRITHNPTGIVVQCQNERSQHKNKATAMKMLKAKLYEHKKKEMEIMIEGKAGDKKDISWGNQIRSYVFQPYTLVKDHRTNEESGNVPAVMDGGLTPFIYAYLKEINRLKMAARQ